MGTDSRAWEPGKRWPAIGRFLTRRGLEQNLMETPLKPPASSDNSKVKCDPRTRHSCLIWFIVPTQPKYLSVRVCHPVMESKKFIGSHPVCIFDPASDMSEALRALHAYVVAQIVASCGRGVLLPGTSPGPWLILPPSPLGHRHSTARGQPHDEGAPSSLEGRPDFMKGNN